MKLEVSFDELNTFLARHTRSGVWVQPYSAQQDALRITLRRLPLPLHVTLWLYYLADGHTLVFHYRLPLLLRAAAHVWRRKIQGLLPEGIIEVDYQQRLCTLYLHHIAGMEQYFEHFEVSGLVVGAEGLVLEGRLRG